MGLSNGWSLRAEQRDYRANAAAPRMPSVTMHRRSALPQLRPAAAVVQTKVHDSCMIGALCSERSEASG
jgi:hypothetical protein